MTLHLDVSDLLLTRSSISPVPPSSLHSSIPQQDASHHSPVYSYRPGRYGVNSYDRWKALFAKYGLSFEESEWSLRHFTSPQPPPERVKKAVRMRVRFTCHQCQTQFGAEKECLSCAHRRCGKCVRYPFKKSNKSSCQDTNTTATVVAKEIEIVPQNENTAAPFLMRQSKTPGAADLVHKAVVQRTRRTCHQCSTQFSSGQKQCATCEHTVCTKCPRDPPNLGKYPQGYPGDTMAAATDAERHWRRPRVRVRYTCQECQNVFREGQSACSHCKHARCDQCPREPPRKPGRGVPSEESIKRVQEKLAALDAGLGGSTGG